MWREHAVLFRLRHVLAPSPSSFSTPTAASRMCPSLHTRPLAPPHSCARTVGKHGLDQLAHLADRHFHLVLVALLADQVHDLAGLSSLGFVTHCCWLGCGCWRGLAVVWCGVWAEGMGGGRKGVSVSGGDFQGSSRGNE
jgi:hypothetical protein